MKKNQKFIRNKYIILNFIVISSVLPYFSCSSFGGIKNIGKKELEFESPNIRVERFPDTFNIKAKGPVKCSSNPCGQEEITGTKFKSLLRDGVWEEYLEKQEGEDPKNKLSFLSKKGKYVNGKKEGEWEEYLVKEVPNTKKNYSVLDKKGIYKDGERSGIWTYYYDEGAGRIGPKLKEANFENGKKDGKETKFNKEGLVIEISHYKNDLLNGEYINKTQGGLLEQEGQYLDDKKTGEWKEYHAKGKDDKLKAIINYKEDKKHGKETRYYEDGKTKIAEGTFEDGLEKGPWKYFYDNGNVETEGAYIPIKAPEEPEVKDDTSSPTSTATLDVRSQVDKPKAKKIGEWKRYYKSGGLFFEGERDGKPKGTWTFYYKDGKVAAKGNMANDFMMKSGEIYDRSGNIEGKGKMRISIFKLDPKTDDIQIKYTPDAPFVFYKNGEKHIELTDKTISGGLQAYEFSGGSKVGEGALEPATRRKNGCWNENGKKVYYMLGKPKTGTLAKMNKCE
ncbi:MAG: LIC20035 family adhesin [Leptospiraceae bacterium]|nr:LIC20035 family adhesin [Leptospiraceae bacterium]